ncbi:RING/Ubox like zinc-binding domain-domain-containing protein [Catenaria anguillulae PL171]|uniref:RING/Ubox like zinc-binding domain-domain-containing protein n=1 Tax=Catenaria anguillulae PL171 TaxID=765915 RepID=A0A1Y2HEX8_9FUNG|nr:RING/Ubox like zinc-binding domain-domain-containing protein [Catenaria anguillulae PL171]
MDDTFASSAPNDELLCPLCCEEIDPVDKYFYPCPCGYQICRFCWNHIREDLNNLCPACRREFDDASVQFTPPPPDEIARIQADRKRRKLGAKKAPTGGYDANDRSHLKDIKVTQRTLVYVTNMPPKYAVEDVLMGEPYFGQFGRILKLSISRRPPLTQGGKTGENQIGIHVTYASAQEALRCIQYVDGAQIENRTLHATYGQTKYCAVWLQNRACNTPNCMFLHEVVADNDSAPVPPVYAFVFVLSFPCVFAMKSLTQFDLS